MKKFFIGAGALLLIAILGRGIWAYRQMIADKQVVYTSKVESTQSVVLPVVATTTPMDVVASWKTYQNTQYGFEVKYPITLVLATSTTNNLSNAQIFMIGLNEGDFPTEKINQWSGIVFLIRLEKVFGDFKNTIDELVKTRLKDYNDTFHCNLKMSDIEQKRFNVNGIEASSFSGFCGPGGKIIYFTKNSELFTIISTLDDDLLNKILLNFKFTNSIIQKNIETRDLISERMNIEKQELIDRALQKIIPLSTEEKNHLATELVALGHKAPLSDEEEVLLNELSKNLTGRAFDPNLEVKYTIIKEVKGRVNGIVVPPAPNKVANDATLAGIDTNVNGVRDDVERFIAQKFGANKEMYNFLMKDAKLFQATIIEKRPPEMSEEEQLRLMKSGTDNPLLGVAAQAFIAFVTCVENNDTMDMMKLVTIATANTGMRGAAYGNALAGAVLSSENCPK